MAIEAKVATIFNQRDLAINAGVNKGVKINDLVRVVRRTDVEDPDTGELLGRSETTLISLQVTSVSERYSIARTFESLGGRIRTVSEVPTGLASTTIVTPGMDVVVETPPPPPDFPDEELPF